ncbi:hypothetical protein BGW36DRAFT_421941 [Talaromyces proteolyticus]|uniref:HD domain-containing protein n=1 Tax=Talaromyces proteolyticus TaxID=1131652 RepID=A0AAD4L7H2_9EURO|nr:uncharacterized protein BGW36DRAFT_421941 [Talaromyces proteolyticus]KAH8705379.1 hypothetical protein BGW36DRAFT_421941 [Talaromyces proteolyticus]
MCQNEVGINGWTSMPADAGAIFGGQPFINEPRSLSIDEIKFPSDHSIVEKTLQYVKRVLHPETFNHSMRVYYYGKYHYEALNISRPWLTYSAGMAITQQQFPQQAAVLSPVTWALTCLLHDLGTAEENLTATRMSFDIYGGIKALQLLEDFGANLDQAKAVDEAIIRHEDMGVDGTITYIGQLIQLATAYDNTSIHPRIKEFWKIIHPSTREQVNRAHTRLDWSKFFSSTIRKEEAIKPWCHSTHLVNFAEEIENNALMKQLE